MKLTIIIPVYNEINTISILLNKVIETKVYRSKLLLLMIFQQMVLEKLLEIILKKIDKLNIHEKNSGKRFCNY